MHGVEPHQRVKRGPEEVRADRQMVREDKPVPLDRGGIQERSTQEYGEKPPATEEHTGSLAQGALCQHNCGATGEQAERREHRHL